MNSDFNVAHTNASHALILHAQNEPIAGIVTPRSNQRYRYPRLTLEQRPLSKIPKDHLRVRMYYAGICGTDVHTLKTNGEGYIRSSAPMNIPSHGRVLGHEGVGEIIGCGENANGWAIGEMVAFESIVSCRNCRACRLGFLNQCEHSQLFGFEIDGLFATVVDVPVILANRIGALAQTTTGLRAAACLEPAAVAWLACERAALRGGERVLIFGGGPIGAFCAMLCREIFSAAQIHVIEPMPVRRQIVEQWATTSASLSTLDHDDEAQYDVVFEASGCLDNIEQVFPHIGAQGRVVLLARSGEPLHLTAVDHWITQGISISGSRGHLGGAVERLIALQLQGRIKLESIVTHIIGDSQANSEAKITDAIDTSKTVAALNSLKDVLEQPDQIQSEQCKVLVRLY